MEKTRYINRIKDEFIEKHLSFHHLTKGVNFGLEIAHSKETVYGDIHSSKLNAIFIELYHNQ